MLICYNKLIFLEKMHFLRKDIAKYAKNAKKDLPMQKGQRMLVTSTALGHTPRD